MIDQYLFFIIYGSEKNFIHIVHYVCVCMYVCRLSRWHSGKESACQCRRYGFDLWVRNISGVGSGSPLQLSCLENPMVRGA